MKFNYVWSHTVIMQNVYIYCQKFKKISKTTNSDILIIQRVNIAQPGRIICFYS